MARMGRADVLQGLMPDVSRYKPGVKFFLQQLALLVLVFLVARPQMGAKLETVKRQGVEIMIALDVSNSMLAQDITPSRLENAKMMLSRLLDDLDDDKVGLIVFAGDAYVQLPITTDFVSANTFQYLSIDGSYAGYRHRFGHSSGHELFHPRRDCR